MNRKFTRWDSAEERIWGRVSKTDSCWIWTGRLTSKGYGTKVRYQGRAHYPHRLVYALKVGEIPAGLVLDHLCRNRACVNPDHLEPVSAIENTSRGVEARWVEPCRNGHPAATFRRTLPSGKNICVECRRISDRDRDVRHREARRAAARERYQARRNRNGGNSINRKQAA